MRGFVVIVALAVLAAPLSAQHQHQGQPQAGGQPSAQAPAIRKPGADGKPVENTLGIDTGGPGVDFYVNGEKVVNLPPHPHLKPLDGVYGLRVNHRLNLHVTDLKVTKKPA